MTPYEYTDIAQSNFANSLSVFAVILSIVSGYLITAYLVGAKLAKSQVSILTIIFLLVMGILTWSMTAYTYWGIVFAELGSADRASATFLSPRYGVLVYIAVLNLFTIAMCLLFMWNVRRSGK